MSHRILQGAPTESNENSSDGRIPHRIRKDTLYINIFFFKLKTH